MMIRADMYESYRPILTGPELQQFEIANQGHKNLRA